MRSHSGSVTTAPPIKSAQTRTGLDHRYAGEPLYGVERQRDAGRRRVVSQPWALTGLNSHIRASGTARRPEALNRPHRHAAESAVSDYRSDGEIAMPDALGTGADQSRVASLLAMQRTIGNQLVARYIQRTQAHAHTVQRNPDPISSPKTELSSSTDQVASHHPTELSLLERDSLFDRATSGAPTQLPFKTEMEQGFHEDLSGVRAHTGDRAAADGLGNLGAAAATRGDQVAFRTPSPSRALVAHEVAHVVQFRVGNSVGEAEVEADRAAGLVAAGRQAEVRVQASAGPYFAPGDPFPGTIIMKLKAIDSGASPRPPPRSWARCATCRSSSLVVNARPCSRAARTSMSGGICGAPLAHLKSKRQPKDCSRWPLRPLSSRPPSPSWAPE